MLCISDIFLLTTLVAANEILVFEPCPKKLMINMATTHNNFQSCRISMFTILLDRISAAVFSFRRIVSSCVAMPQVKPSSFAESCN